MVIGTGGNDVGDGWIEGRKGIRKRGEDVVIGFRVYRGGRAYLEVVECWRIIGAGVRGSIWLGWG